MKPDLRKLLPDVVLFVAVARAKNFSHAAKTLQMSISTLSRRILDFEAKLGAQLLLRSTRRVELTEIGLRYFERCKLVLEAAEEAQMELRGAVEDAQGTLRVSATQDFALLWVKPIIEEVLARYPKISFELDLTSRPVDLIAEGFDVAIRLGPLPDSQLFARKLGAMTMGVYAAPGYLKRASAPTAPSELRGHECLRLRGQAERSSPWTLMRGTQVVAVDVKGRVVANAMRVLLELAADGLGVALLGEAFAAQAVGDGRLVRVLPEWNTGVDQVHALTPSKLLPSRTRIFLDSLSEHLQPPYEPRRRRRSATSDDRSAWISLANNTAMPSPITLNRLAYFANGHDTKHAMHLSRRQDRERTPVLRRCLHLGGAIAQALGRWLRPDASAALISLVATCSSAFRPTLERAGCS